jgi:hypothetical protein
MFILMDVPIKRNTYNRSDILEIFNLMAAGNDISQPPAG